MNRPQILLIGVNHKTAPVEIRERLTLDGDLKQSLALLKSLPETDEVLFLSTCNRVEILTATKDGDKALDTLLNLWLERSGLTESDLEKGLYVRRDTEAIAHLFRVASSLDSMVVGEPQILGQLKDAYRAASESNATGTILNRLLHKAFSVAKRVRTETSIASHAVSISYAAVELARKIFGELNGKTAMLVGAGEMAELAAQHLKTHGVKKLIVANRTLERAVQLSKELDGEPIALDEMDDALIEADIVISSTGAPGTVISASKIKKIMRPRRHRLLFLIDIAVPRDIEPEVNEIDNVYLYDIDDLKGVVELNKTQREKEARKAERIVEEEVIKFENWLESLEIVPVIQMLQKKAENLRKKELERSMKALKDLTPKQQKALDVLTRSIVQKILHDPIITIKNGTKNGLDSRALLENVCRLFNLDAVTEENKPAANNDIGSSDS